MRSHQFMIFMPIEHLSKCYFTSEPTHNLHCSCFKYWSFSNKVFLKIMSLKKKKKKKKKKIYAFIAKLNEIQRCASFKPLDVRMTATMDFYIIIHGLILCLLQTVKNRSKFIPKFLFLVSSLQLNIFIIV